RQRSVGRRGRADDLRGGSRRAQRLLCGDRQAHPRLAAQEREDLPGINGRAATSVVAARCLLCLARLSPMSRTRVLVVAGLLLTPGAAASAEPRADAASCSGGHPCGPTGDT